MLVGRGLALIAVIASLAACTDAVPEMGLLSKKTNLQVQFKEQVLYENQIYIRSVNPELLIEGETSFSEFAVGEGTSCDSLAWQSAKTSYPVVISPGDGPKTISYRYRSKKAEYDCVQYPFILDTSAPGATSFQVTGDRDIGGVRYVGAGRTLDLALQGQQVTQMKISDDATCSSGSWEPFVSDKAKFPISAGDGTRAVSVMYRNKFKVETACLTQGFVLDTTGPDLVRWSPGFVPAILEQTTRTESPQYNGVPVDALSGFDRLEVAVGTSSGNQSIAPWSPVNTPAGKVSGLNLAIGVYYLNFRAFDILGNSSAGFSREFRVKPLLPTLELEYPLTSPNNIAEIRLRATSAAGQTVNVYNNANCTGTALGTGLNLTGPTSSVTLGSLSSDGVYEFYAEALENGISSGCNPVGISYSLDRTPPSFTVTRTGPFTGNIQTDFRWTIEVSGAPTALLTSAMIDLEGSASGCTKGLVRSGVTFNYELTVSGCTGFGNLGFRILQNSLYDSFGNGNVVFVTDASLQVSLSNTILVEFEKPGDVVAEVNGVTNQEVRIVSSGQSGTAIRVWYKTLPESTYLQDILAASSNLLPGYVDIPVGQRSAILQYQYTGNLPSAGSRSLQLVITAITSTASTGPANYVGASAFLGTKQVFRRFIAASDGSSEVAAVKVSDGISCLLTPAGRIKCWGANSPNLLGSPAAIVNKPLEWDASSGFTYKSVVIAETSICGLTTTGYLRCNGSNSHGELAVGTFQTLFTSVVDSGFDGSANRLRFSEVSAFGFGMCGLQETTGLLYCWGANEKGESGNPFFGVSLSSATLVSNDRYVSVARGANHTCAVHESGSLRCFGDGSYGQIGIIDPSGTASMQNPDSSNPGIHYTKVFSGKETSCGLTTANILKCWGRYVSSTGTFSLAASSSLARVFKSDSMFRDVSIGESHFCGLFYENSGPANTGRAFCYGSYRKGQLGVGYKENLVVQTGLVVYGDEYFKSISAFGDKTCGLTAENILKCWGDRRWALGDGGAGNVRAAQIIDRGSYYKSVASGNKFTCAITQDDNLKCWGENSGGQVGDTTGRSRSAPLLIDTGVKYLKVAAGYNHACGITSNYRLKCWGYNTNNQIGSGNNVPVFYPAALDTSVQYRDVAVGRSHTCGITLDSKLRCWGANSAGQLGDGTTTARSSPVAIDPPTNYKSLSLGEAHTCALTDGDVLKCWGANGSGQLGNGSTTATNTPQIISSGITFSKVSAGADATCAVTTGGQLLCTGPWRLVNPSTTQDRTSLTAVAVSGVSGTIQDVSVGDAHACASNTANELYCWGSNTYEQTGTPNGSNRVGAVDSIQVSAGFSHTCSVALNGQLFCWGQNDLSSVGDGQADSSFPIAIGP